jgi:hypothetical protein
VTSPDGATARSISGLFRRSGRFDSQPQQPVAVMLASYGIPFSRAAIKEALKLSGGGPVGVITIARIYGSAFGLPNPGLLPTAKELADRQAEVSQAVQAIESRGVEAWGQVAASRRPARAIVKATRARGAGHVVVCTAPAPRWRAIVEGDPVKELQRRAGKEIDVTGVMS